MPVDPIEIVARNFHVVWQRLALETGHPGSGRDWEAMPASYQLLLRRTLERLIQNGDIAPNWWR